MRLGLLGDEGGYAVHRLLEASLLLGLEQRMILERILCLVAVDRHLPVERGVLLLECQMILDHLGEQRRCLYRHNLPPDRGRALLRAPRWAV
jgi:hypothetical protein